MNTHILVGGRSSYYPSYADKLKMDVTAGVVGIIVFFVCLGLFIKFLSNIN